MFQALASLNFSFSFFSVTVIPSSSRLFQDLGKYPEGQSLRELVIKII